MGVKHRAVKAHELRRGDVIVHAKTRERYRFIAAMFTTGRIFIREAKAPNALPLVIRCESDQDVLIEVTA